MTQSPVLRLFHWIGRHVRGFHSAVGAFLIAGLLTTLITCTLLLYLAETVAGGAIQRLDESVVESLAELRSPPLDVLAAVGAVIGSRAVAWITIVLGTLALWTTRHRYSATMLWVGIGGSVFLNRLLKQAFARPRPYAHRETIEILGRSFQYPDSFSFPSGHALLSTSIFFTLGYLVARLEATRTMRRFTLGAALVAVTLVGLSRVYLGVHYPSDVVGGILAGLMWSTAAALGVDAVGYFRSRKPGLAEVEEGIEKPGSTPLSPAADD